MSSAELKVGGEGVSFNIDLQKAPLIGLLELNILHLFLIKLFFLSERS